MCGASIPETSNIYPTALKYICRRLPSALNFNYAKLEIITKLALWASILLVAHSSEKRYV